MGNCFGFNTSSSYLLDNVDESYEDLNCDFINNQSHPPTVPTYHPTPSSSILASDLTEEEQIQIVKRIHMLQSLPSASYVPMNKEKPQECIICMLDLKLGDEVRYLPCLHTYHRLCIDEWLMRSFSCPTCLLVPQIDNTSPLLPPPLLAMRMTTTINR